MRARLLYGFGLGLIGLGLLTSFSGCHMPNPRHGLVFRGDWTLELNRVPWMADRGLGEYQQPCAPCDVSGQGGCVKAKPSPGLEETACVRQQCKPPMGCLAKPCIAKSCPALHSSHSGGPPMGGGSPRFFPVPTKPVFSPRVDAANSIIEVPVSDAQSDSFASAPSLKLQDPGGEGNPPAINPEVVPPPPGSKPLPNPIPPIADSR